MDLGTRVAGESSTQTKQETTAPNGITFKAVIEQASPSSSPYPTSSTLHPARRDSLPIQQSDRLHPDTLITSSDAPTPLSSDSESPTRRRSVQFARDVNQETTADDGAENPPGFAELLKDRRGVSLLSKLKAFTSSSTSNAHVRSPSGQTVGHDSIDERFNIFTPASEITPGPRSASFLTPHQTDAESDDNSGQEQSSADATRPRRTKRSRRLLDGGARTAPTTPKTPFESDRPHLFSWHSSATSGDKRRSFLRRRATMDDMHNTREDAREDTADDEAPPPNTESEPRTRRTDLLRPMSYSRFRTAHQRSTSDQARPGTIRRAFTGIRDRHDGEPSPWRVAGDRTASLSAAKWRQIKAGLRTIGRLRKAQTTIDHAKSAELLAELSAGTPAALMLASMFLRDDHGNRRVPILLEQVKVKVQDAREENEQSGRQTWFRIELEYGNGLTRMKWVIYRHFLDFANLHTRLKVQRQTQKIKTLRKDEAGAKVPRFPRQSFPWLRGIAGTGVSDSEGEDEADDPERAESNPPERADRPIAKARKSFQNMRRKSSLPGTPGINGEAAAALAADTQKKRQELKTRENLEKYLRQTIRYVMFRPESNRLCRFLEISALGVRLAAEDSYHGKEGPLRIVTGKGVDFRRTLTSLSTFKARHDSKWFLVRHSYIVCVDSPEAMNVYDVFLLDSDFQLEMRKDQSTGTKAKSKALRHHLLKLNNSERKLKLLVQHERQLDQWYSSINQMIDTSPWSKKNRFDSFAPIRTNVFAQWLVDGRDYMWNVSRAINEAKDVIYIHDWWLSPELYMRRPACISKKWRLDRLLQRKAREGVKIFVIVYRNINSAIPIDSEYTKFSLLDLDSNVFVQRSPNQIRQATFFWAHHEKLCIVDNMVAFVGGIDLCFGRWDTPGHEVADDKLTGFEDTDIARNADNCQMWPGKDYSNPRVQDFFALDKPYEEMYDRSKTARMPWHDISMQVVGQPARDLTRHFVQRWNYILRQRKPSRPTPFLLPPAEISPKDVESLGLNGTCEVQMLRSCGMWSMGTPTRTEHSIMTAYSKAILNSDHFVYIENQFFISTCEMDGTKIENTIGDALVERILRAEENGEDWRAVIVIPLVPGFQNTVDSPDGTSIRLIMQCQYRSICRGESSIFGRLRANGIHPDKYIKFFSLRSWGKIGHNKVLVTEQLYIHAKCMIVDDRIAIIGSANINERSMLGNRDSECAAVVRDHDMIWSTMGGQPYPVGRFPHTLRMRLMREHLGIDVDADIQERFMRQVSTDEVRDILGDLEKAQSSNSRKKSRAPRTAETAKKDLLARTESLRSFNATAAEDQSNNPHLQSGKRLTRDPRVTENPAHRRDVEGYGFDHMLGPPAEDARPPSSSALSRRTTNNSILGRKQSNSSRGNLASSQTDLGSNQTAQLPERPKVGNTEAEVPAHEAMDKTSISHRLLSTLRLPEVNQDCMQDPLIDSFYTDIWDTVAQNNTAIFRAVFRCQPDDDVTRWAEYKAYAAYAERFQQSQGGGTSTKPATSDRPITSGPPGSGPIHQLQALASPIANTAISEKVSDIQEKAKERPQAITQLSQPHIEGTVKDWAADATAENEKRSQGVIPEKDAVLNEKEPILDEKAAYDQQASSEEQAIPALQPQDSPTTATAPRAEPAAQHRREHKNTIGASSKRNFRASDDVLSREEALSLLEKVQGHLIIWPYEWLAKEEQGGRWLFPIDQLAPLEIYN